MGDSVARRLNSYHFTFIGVFFEKQNEHHLKQRSNFDEIRIKTLEFLGDCKTFVSCIYEQLCFHKCF